MENNPKPSLLLAADATERVNSLNKYHLFPDNLRIVVGYIVLSVYCGVMTFVTSSVRRVPRVPGKGKGPPRRTKSQQGPSKQSCPPNRKHRPGKHGSSDGDGDDDDDGVGGASGPVYRGVRKGATRLACPFYKRDQHKFIECLTRQTLITTADVLQHLRRAHWNENYCPTCGEGFKTPAERDAHIIERLCQERNLLQEGILDRDRYDRLRERSHNSELAGRWYNIWDVIFRDVPRPDSPYVGNVFEEIIGWLRDLCRYSRGADSAVEYLTNYLATQGVPLRNGGSVRPLVLGILECVLETTHIRSFLPGHDPVDSQAINPRNLFNLIEQTDNPSSQPAQAPSHPVLEEAQDASEHPAPRHPAPPQILTPLPPPAGSSHNHDVPDSQPGSDGNQIAPYYHPLPPSPTSWATLFDFDRYDMPDGSHDDNSQPHPPT